MKVYLPNPKFIFSVLIHAVIYYWDVKLWGRSAMDNVDYIDIPLQITAQPLVCYATDIFNLIVTTGTPVAAAWNRDGSNSNAIRFIGGGGAFGWFGFF